MQTYLSSSALLRGGSVVLRQLLWLCHKLAVCGCITQLTLYHTANRQNIMPTDEGKLAPVSYHGGIQDLSVCCKQS